MRIFSQKVAFKCKTKEQANKLIDELKKFGYKFNSCEYDRPSNNPPYIYLVNKYDSNNDLGFWDEIRVKFDGYTECLKENPLYYEYEYSNNFNNQNTYYV